MQHERDRTRLALTQQVAERLNGDLQELAATANVLAATVAQRSDWTEQQLELLLRNVLASEPQVFALNVGFEPGQFAADRQDFCLYVYRGENKIETKQLLPPAYVPLYREWDWYTQPRDARRALWSEPYVDTGGGDIPMVTFTAPILRGEKFAGVVSLDLSAAYFSVLRQWLEELNLGEGSYGMVLSPTGVILRHGIADYDFASLVAAGKNRRNITRLDGAEPVFRSLALKILEGNFGSGKAIDPATNKPATFIFAPVPSAGWTFVAVIQEQDPDNSGPTRR
jgi:sigma-B regulation protein RsbU (phosphoserine phosphatase)